MHVNRSCEQTAGNVWRRSGMLSEAAGYCSSPSTGALPGGTPPRASWGRGPGIRMVIMCIYVYLCNFCRSLNLHLYGKRDFKFPSTAE